MNSTSSIFGDRRALAEVEFRKIFEPALLRNQDFLLRKDMDGYARAILKLGEELAEHHVPLQEIIASLHLFEEAAQAVFLQNPPPTTDVYNKFDKLSHIRIILLVDSYSRSEWAAAATRIHALELEAKYLPPEERTRFHGLVGKSPAMRGLYSRIEAVGRARAIALVVGESGTGKELVAHAPFTNAGRFLPHRSCRSTAPHCPRNSLRALPSAVRRRNISACSGRRRAEPFSWTKSPR
jgi:transcriptional regulator of acetoin/glycerol metabolism